MYFSTMTNIAKNLKRLRIAKGLTQPQLAEELDLTQKQVSDYELAKSTPSLDMLPKIAKYFGITVDDLLGAKEVAADFTPKNGQKSRHGNSRSAQLDELFDQLSPEEQRTTLKQIRGIIADKQRR
jgi:transcriptional regulator with XRE-family HTH domain